MSAVITNENYKVLWIFSSIKMQMFPIATGLPVSALTSMYDGDVFCCKARDSEKEYEKVSREEENWVQWCPPKYMNMSLPPDTVNGKGSLRMYNN